MPARDRLLRTLAHAAGRALVSALRAPASRGRTSDRTVPAPPRSAPTTRGPRHGQDARRATVATPLGRPLLDYAPARDGDADPGEVVWTWVPYEDDPTRGKDRPVLVVGRLGDDVAALELTSRPRDDRHHHPLGVWDPQDGRPSWVALDRVLRLDPDGIRREGAVLDRGRFEATVAAWQAY